MRSGSSKSNDGRRNRLAALAASALAVPLVLSAPSAGTQPRDIGVAPPGSAVLKAARKSERDIIIIGKSAKKKGGPQKKEKRSHYKVAAAHKVKPAIGHLWRLQGRSIC